MGREDLLTEFCCLISALVERSKESLAFQNGVRGPLLLCWGEECVTEPLILCWWGTVSNFTKVEGPHVQRPGGEHWEFNATRGFPGEDISTPL